MDIRKILEAIDENEVLVLGSGFLGMEAEAVVTKDAPFKGDKIGIESSEGVDFYPMEIFTRVSVMKDFDFAIYAMKKMAIEDAPVIIDEIDQL